MSIWRLIAVKKSLLFHRLSLLLSSLIESLRRSRYHVCVVKNTCLPPFEQLKHPFELSAVAVTLFRFQIQFKSVILSMKPVDLRCSCYKSLWLPGGTRSSNFLLVQPNDAAIWSLSMHYSMNAVASSSSGRGLLIPRKVVRADPTCP